MLHKIQTSNNKDQLDKWAEKHNIEVTDGLMSMKMKMM